MSEYSYNNYNQNPYNTGNQTMGSGYNNNTYSRSGTAAEETEILRKGRPYRKEDRGHHAERRPVRRRCGRYLSGRELPDRIHSGSGRSSYEPEFICRKHN